MSGSLTGYITRTANSHRADEPGQTGPDQNRAADDDHPLLSAKGYSGDIGGAIPAAKGGQFRTETPPVSRDRLVRHYVVMQPCGWVSQAGCAKLYKRGASIRHQSRDLKVSLRRVTNAKAPDQGVKASTARRPPPGPNPKEVSDAICHAAKVR